MNAVGHGFKKVFLNVPIDPQVSHFNELGGGEDSRAFDGRKEEALAFFCRHLGIDHVQRADGTAVHPCCFGL